MRKATYVSLESTADEQPRKLLRRVCQKSSRGSAVAGPPKAYHTCTQEFDQLKRKHIGVLDAMDYLEQNHDFPTKSDQSGDSGMSGYHALSTHSITVT